MFHARAMGYVSCPRRRQDIRPDVIMLWILSPYAISTAIALPGLAFVRIVGERVEFVPWESL